MSHPGASGDHRQIVYNQQYKLFLFWDKNVGQYFYYDPESDTLVYPDRRRIARPDKVSRHFYQDPFQQSTSPSALLGRPGGPPAQGLDRHVRSLATQIPSKRQENPYIPAPVEPSVRGEGTPSMRMVYAKDDYTQVCTRFATGPSDQITDPQLFKRGVSATRRLLKTEGEREQMYSAFIVRQPARDFFQIGRVFLVLWVEPAGESGTIVTSFERKDSGIATGRFDERIFSKVRRFVVIHEGDKFCSALPIISYGHRGVGKPRVKKSDHAIIYTGSVPPAPLTEEYPKAGEAGLRSRAINVIPDDTARSRLDPASRIDFAKVHTIDHNIKVKSFGLVDPQSLSSLATHFNAVWNISDTKEYPSLCGRTHNGT